MLLRVKHPAFKEGRNQEVRFETGSAVQFFAHYIDFHRVVTTQRGVETADGNWIEMQPLRG